MELGSLQSIGRSVGNVFKPIIKHHAILFILFALISIIAAVYVSNETLSRPTDDEYRTTAEASAIDTNFDQSTIDQINNLRQRQERPTIELPGGRINPFSN